MEGGETFPKLFLLIHINIFRQFFLSILGNLNFKNLPSSSVKSVNFASEFVVTSCTQIFPFEKYAIKSGFVGDIIGLALVMLLG